MTDTTEIPVEKRTPKWLRLLFFGWFVFSVLLLILTLKPYNKAYKVANHAKYLFSNQTDTANGYVVDYNGVIDFVSYGNSATQAELTIKKSSKFKISVRNKEGAQSEVTCYVNGADVTQFDSKEKRRIERFKLRKNDYLKIKVRSMGDQKSEVEVKLEIDNGAQQRQIYAIILIWIIFGMRLLSLLTGIHMVLPSLLLLTACYVEHLYDPETWWLPMIGFVAGAVSLSLVRFAFAKLNTVGRFINLVLDYVVLLLTVVLSGFIWNYKRYGYKMDYDTIIAVLQSNISETIEFAFTELGFWFVIGLLLLVAIPIGLFILGRQVGSKPFQRSHLYLLIISLILSFLCIQESQFISESSQAYKQYYEEIAKFNEVQNRFKDHSKLEVKKVEQGETYVFVIGESQSKEHMSVYGYHRPTTPFLDSMRDAGELGLFRDAYSSHTHTIMVLRDALTQSNQYNGLKYTDVPSLINVLNAAEFETVWLSNQVKLSNWDNIVSAIASACDEQVYVNKNIGESMANSPHDEHLLPELKQLLANPSKKNRAVFIHVLGNHGQYQERYPKSFKGIPSKGVSDFGIQKDLKVWEAYDNSILYSDYILKQIHQIIDDAPGEIKLLTYFADHAEDLSEGRGHNSGQFTYRMTQIPMYIWANQGYKERYKNKWNRVEGAKGRRFSNDLFFQLALDLTNIETPLFVGKHDVISPSYQIDTFKTKTGSIIYSNPNNYYSNSMVNSTYMTWMEGRIGIHRVNSLGKLNEVQNNDMRSLEVDVKYVDGELKVGHGEEGAMTDISLAQFISEIGLNKLSKLWLDVKNLDKTNLQDVLVRLEAIDSQYQIKSKLIVETQSQDLNISLIAQKGYHTSYYLPTDLINKGEEEQRKAATDIAKQLKYQKVSAISFDSQLYEFVKSKLENKISPNIVYHTWNVNINGRHGDLIDRMNSEPYMKDKRVKTILVSYPSVFDL